MVYTSLSRPRLDSRRYSPLLHRVLLVVALLALVMSPAAAQGPGPDIATTMVTVKALAINILRGAMAIGLVIGLVKVSRNFLNGSPDAISSFLWLIGGTLVFFTWGRFFNGSLLPIGSSSAATGNIGNAYLNPGVSAGAYAMAQKVLNIMLTIVAPLLLFSTVALNVIKGFINNGTAQFELSPIFRAIFMYALLLSYNTVIPLVGDMIGGLAGKINTETGGKSTSAYTVLAQLRTAANAETMAQPGSGGPVAPGANQAGNGTTDGQGLISSFAGDIAGKLKDLASSFSPQKLILGLATDFMTSVIQAIMEFIQSFLLAFLYVAGPIALTFSLLPGFGGLAKSWLQSFIGINMWSVAFQVIGGLFVHYQAYEAAMSTGSAADVIASVTGASQTRFMVACLVFIIMYLLVPMMSSMIVGSSAADGVLGAGIRAGAALAAGAATGGAGAMSMAGAGAKAVNALGSGASMTAKAGSFASGAGSHIASKVGMGGGGNMGQIAQMFQSTPSMPGAGTEGSQGPSIRTSEPAVGAMPKMSTSAPAPAVMNYAQGAGSSGGSSAPPPVSAPTVTANPAVMAQQASAAVDDARNGGGTLPHFSGYDPGVHTAHPAPVMMGQEPPSLPGARS